MAASFVKLSDGSQLKVQVCGPNIIRVVHTKQSTIPSPQSYVVGQTTFTPGTFNAVDNGTTIAVTTPQITATITKSTTLITYTTASGGAITSETGRTLSAVTKGGQAGYSGTLNSVLPRPRRFTDWDNFHWPPGMGQRRGVILGRPTPRSDRAIERPRLHLRYAPSQLVRCHTLFHDHQRLWRSDEFHLPRHENFAA